jgi:hypothetical protein
MIDNDETFRNTRHIIGPEIEEITSRSEDLTKKKGDLALFVDEVSSFIPLVSAKEEITSRSEDLKKKKGDLDLFVDEVSSFSPLINAKNLFSELAGTIEINAKESIHDSRRKPTTSMEKVSRRRSTAFGVDQEDPDENGNEPKVKKGMRVGYYQMTNKALVRYCFIPKALLRSSSFNFDDVFQALNLRTPDLVFELNIAADTSEWNLRLPEDKKNLRSKDFPEVGDNGKLAKPDRYLQHYQGVVRENCKRLLSATSHAVCKHYFCLKFNH